MNYFPSSKTEDPGHTAHEAPATFQYASQEQVQGVRTKEDIGDNGGACTCPDITDRLSSGRFAFGPKPAWCGSATDQQRAYMDRWGCRGVHFSETQSQNAVEAQTNA